MSTNRYQYTKTELDRYKTTRYPTLQKSPSDLYIISRDQDRLDLLSNEFYKDPRYQVVHLTSPFLNYLPLLVPTSI